jgi:hypothetical protein
MRSGGYTKEQEVGRSNLVDCTVATRGWILAYLQPFRVRNRRDRNSRFLDLPTQVKTGRCYQSTNDSSRVHLLVKGMAWQRKADFISEV